MHTTQEILGVAHWVKNTAISEIWKRIDCTWAENPFRCRAKANHRVTNRTRDSFRGVVCIMISLFQPKWFYNSNCVTEQHQVELVHGRAISHNTPVTAMLAGSFISKPQMAFIQNPSVKTCPKCWVILPSGIQRLVTISVSTNVFLKNPKIVQNSSFKCQVWLWQ